MESKNKKLYNQNFMITTAISVAAFIAFVGGFSLSEGITPKKYKTIVKENDNEVIIATTTLADSLKFSQDKVYPNNENVSYHLKTKYYGNNENSYYVINYGEVGNELEFQKYENKENVNNEIITFESNVTDIAINYTNDEIKENAIVIILENGDVNYIKASNNGEDVVLGNVEKLPEAHDVIKYYEGVSCDNEDGRCLNDIYVQSTDGSLYSVNGLIY